MKKQLLSITTAATLLFGIHETNAQNFIINTYAGNGTYGNSGDGGQATAAEFEFPQGVAKDADGNLYVSDYNNNSIRKVTTAGIIRVAITWL